MRKKRRSPKKLVSIPEEILSMIRSKSIKKKQETRTDSRKSNRTLGQIQEEVIENESRFKNIICKEI